MLCRSAEQAGHLRRFLNAFVRACYRRATGPVDPPFAYQPHAPFTRTFNGIDVVSRRHALRAFPHGLPAYRRCPHGLVQLALRASFRWPHAAAHRGYRPGALHPGRDRRDSRWMRWLGLDWDGDVIYQFARAERHRRGRRESPRGWSRLSLLRNVGGARRDARVPPAPKGARMRYDGRWRDRDPPRPRRA